jgi:hypothetical protein
MEAGIAINVEKTKYVFINGMKEKIVMTANK